MLVQFLMDANGASSQWYRKVKPQGKVRRRVQDLRIPSSSSFDFWSRRPPLDLSHNEGARLAVDGLLSGGLEGYHTVLNTEGEVDFLSEQEKNYFLEHGKDGNTDGEPDAEAEDGSDTEFESLSSSTHSVTQCPSESKDSDGTEAGLSSKDDNGSSASSEANVEAYLYSEKKSAGLKDVVREFIRKAEKSLAVVTDSFSDVELLCDLLEASKKRFVSVHLLLDHLNLSIFRDVWQELQLQGKDFPKFSVLSAEGQTFCTKTGRKLNGQISETFIITDWTEALIGSFSFSWLSWLVHRNLAFLVKGSAVTHFLQEFERLSSCSTLVPGFQNVPLTLPIKTKSRTSTTRTKGKTTSDQTEVVHIWDWIEDGLNSHTKERTQMSILVPQFPRPLRQPVMQHMCMEKFTKPALGGLTVQDKEDNRCKPLTPRKAQFQNNLRPYCHSPQNSVNQSTMGKSAVVINGAPQQKSALLSRGQDKTLGSSQSKNFNIRHYNVTHENYWGQRQNETFTAPPGIAAGISKLREERNTSKIKSNPSNKTKIMHGFMSQEKSEKQGIQSSLSSAQGAGYVLQNTVKSNGMKTLTQSTTNHFTQSQTTMRSPTAGVSVQPKLESNFSPAGGNKAVLQPRATQQVKPSSRLSWMTQNNTATRPMTRPVSFYSYDIVPKMDGQRQFHNAAAKPLARSKSMTERPVTRLNFK